MIRGRRLNCWMVALWFWLASRCRSVIGVRRSESFRGLIPHCLVIRERGNLLTVIDYVPRRRKSGGFWRGDFALLFKGFFRVRRYRLVAVGEGDCARSALYQMRKGDRDVC